MEMVIAIPAWFYPVLIWTLIMKGIAMWKAAKNNQIFWFVAALIINTVGILPLLYIAFFQRDLNTHNKEVNKYL